MLTQTHTVCFRGIQSLPIDVQTHITGGSLPSFSIVGLPDKTISEARERIRSALFTLGLALPPKRIIINLAPANIQKEGSHYDLPMMISLMMALDVIPHDLSTYISLGELGLDGSLKPVHGILSAALFAASVGRSLICPAACGGEAMWGGDLCILAPGSLLELINHFRGTQVLSLPIGLVNSSDSSLLDFSEIKGQETAKRVLLIAAAGGHNVLMSGPPGSGKSMMASRMMSLLPPLSAKDALEVTMIHGMLTNGHHKGLIRRPPFRNPHHSASVAALIGGGIRSMPGEISLAHKGILFLDELPEFHRNALEALRQPLESGEAVIARANYHITYPACFQLIAAMNPCQCGYLGMLKKQCHKAPACGDIYRRHLSGPLLDRIDLFVDVPEISCASLPKENETMSSEAFRQCIAHARLYQEKRYAPCSYDLNRFAAPLFLDQELSDPVRSLLIRAMDKWQLSMRSYYKVIRVARTIADLGHSHHIQTEHIREALSYRSGSLFSSDSFIQKKKNL